MQGSIGEQLSGVQAEGSIGAEALRPCSCALLITTFSHPAVLTEAFTRQVIGTEETSNAPSYREVSGDSMNLPSTLRAKGQGRRGDLLDHLDPSGALQAALFVCFIVIGGQGPLSISDKFRLLEYRKKRAGGRLFAPPIQICRMAFR